MREDEEHGEHSRATILALRPQAATDVAGREHAKSARPPGAATSLVDGVRMALLVPVRDALAVPVQRDVRADLAWRSARGRKMPTHSPPAWRTLG